MSIPTDPEENNETSISPIPASSKRYWWLFLALAIILIAVFFVLNKDKAASDTSAAKPGATKGLSQIAPVTAVPARKGDVGVYLGGLGSVLPLNTVTVKSRVDGQLMEVRFREGQNVTKGDLLAVIDPRPYQVQLTQAEGQMARDQELLRNARTDLERYRQLWEQDSIPKQQLDTQQALVRQLEGTVKIDQGQIDSARLQLIYSRVTAPASGRVGLRQVDPGNIVHSADTSGLVIITQLNPITVVFPIPEDNLPKLFARFKSGSSLAVDAYDREQKQKLASGKLLTVDNQIDPTTGTVKLKAIFPNKDNQLFPNQFVNARLLLETRRDVVIVPAAAIQRGSQGTFVYLVKADKTVSIKPVTIGVAQADDVSIVDGLTEGDLVVIDGAERLREGSQVDVKDPAKGAGKVQGKKPGKSQGETGAAQRPAR